MARKRYPIIDIMSFIECSDNCLNGVYDKAKISAAF